MLKCKNHLPPKSPSQYENMFRHFAWKYPDRVSANIYYSEDMSHKIYASCDAFLMPSLFEPCGLSQLMSLRYGTVPIVRETGGLKDTVEPYNEYESTGTGFSFANYNAHEMLSIVNYAKDVYYRKCGKCCFAKESKLLNIFVNPAVWLIASKIEFIINKIEYNTIPL